MNKTYKHHFIKAGELASQVRSFGKGLIQPGAAYSEVWQKIRHKIFELGAIPAFPPQIALNEVAAHFLPQPNEEMIFSDQVVKLDVGVCYQGAIGDCAVTVDLSGKHQKLVDAAETALLRAEQIIQVGLPIREIGRVIEGTIKSQGFRPIKNLSGHGLGLYKIHTPPSIPNYDDGSKGVIKPGMTFAIEPFVTNGSGGIYEEGNATIFSLLSKRLPRSEVASLLLAKIKTFAGLPFAIHDLLDDKMTLRQVKLGLAELIKWGAIAEYRPLVEEKGGLVAQAENSVLVDENGEVFITTRILNA